jgi:hypothetical protein
VHGGRRLVAELAARFFLDRGYRHFADYGPGGQRVEPVPGPQGPVRVLRLRPLESAARPGRGVRRSTAAAMEGSPVLTVKSSRCRFAGHGGVAYQPELRPERGPAVKPKGSAYPLDLDKISAKERNLGNQGAKEQTPVGIGLAGRPGGCHEHCK